MPSPVEASFALSASTLAEAASQRIFMLLIEQMGLGWSVDNANLLARASRWRIRQELKQPGKMTLEWLRKNAAKGGSVKGPCKKRGDAEYYRQLRLKRKIP